MIFPTSFFERLLLGSPKKPMIKHEAQGDESINYVMRDNPNHLGIMALCSYYRLKKGIDISYSPKADFFQAFKKIVTLPGNSIFGVVYNFSSQLEGGRDFPDIVHCVPIIFFKNNDEIGIFVHDGLDYRNENIIERLRHFMRLDRKISQRNPLIFIAKSSTQLGSFGCRIKSVQDCVILLTLDGIKEFLEEQILKANKCELVKNKEGYYDFEFPDKLYRTSEETKFLNRRPILRMLEKLKQINNSEVLIEIESDWKHRMENLIKDRSQEIDSLVSEMVLKIKEAIQKIKETKGLEFDDEKYKTLISEKTAIIDQVYILVQKADELLEQKFKKMIVSKTGMSAEQYFEKYSCEVGVADEVKTQNLILSEKSLHASQKIFAMIKALGFERVKEEMINSCTNPELARKYIDEVELRCDVGGLRFVIIAELSKRLLAPHLGNEPIITESVKKEPQELLGEELEKRSPSFRKSYDFFTKQQEKETIQSQEIGRKPERKKPTTLPKASSVAGSPFVRQKLQRELPEIPKRNN